MNPLISIIVPVYNAEKYLIDCVESILRQRYCDFELVLVNDGSRDSSLEICRKFAENDSRIVIIDKINGGVSSARNAGIASARGKWFTFIDSDDWVESDYLETLLMGAESESDNVDWVTSGITYCYENGSRETENPEYFGLYKTDSPSGLLAVAAQRLVTSPVGKLYKSKIIADNRLEFDPKLSYGEDRDFNLKYLGNCSSCLITELNAYNYRKDIASSLSTTKQGDLLNGDLDYWANLYSLFNHKGFMSVDVRRYLINRQYNFIIDYIWSYKLSDNQIGLIQSRIDWVFVRENSTAIEGNRLCRWLFVHRKINLLNRIISLRAK